MKNGKARSVVHVDRQALGVLESEEVWDTATYCSFVHKSGKPFLTGDAANDPRTVTHVARDIVRAYAGVPVLAADGRFLGTLCHYDLEPRDPDQLDLQLLREVGGLHADDAVSTMDELSLLALKARSKIRRARHA